MTAYQAYQAFQSRQPMRFNEAHGAGWVMPEYHGATVIMRNRKTGETCTGVRTWSKTANDYGKRVRFSA